MILRSAAAGNVDAVLMPKQGCASLSPLVVKASAGAIFRCPLVRCERLENALTELQKREFKIAVLSGNGEQNLFKHSQDSPTIYVLGNESEGVAEGIEKLADFRLHIPMQRGVESLNVAVTASLIAFASN